MTLESRTERQGHTGPSQGDSPWDAQKVEKQPRRSTKGPGQTKHDRDVKWPVHESRKIPHRGFSSKSRNTGMGTGTTGSFPTLMRPRLVVVRTPPDPKWGVHLPASGGWGWQEAVPPPGQQEQKPVAPPWGLSPRTGVMGLVPRRPLSLACRGPSPPVSPVSSHGRCPSERVCVLISSCKVTTQLALGPTWGPHFTLITP